MLRATSLFKSYNSTPAVAGVTLEAAPGEIVGLLGPNGAGKSTTVSMLCGLIRPDRGSVTIDGEAVGGNASGVKRRLGLVPQDISLFEELSAMGNLELFGALYGVRRPLRTQRAHAALALVGLEDRARALPSTFSGGMKRRLNLACALVHDPDVLLLDEPTVGVDPQSRNAIFANLEALRARGKAIVYTTHYMEEAERLCDRIVIVDHGQVVAAGTKEALRALLPASAVRKVVVEGPSLEDVFLHLTGRQLRD
jgi:ABC-2 type transport system ATP-binding protein